MMTWILNIKIGEYIEADLVFVVHSFRPTILQSSSDEVKFKHYDVNSGGVDEEKEYSSKMTFFRMDYLEDEAKGKTFHVSSR